MLDNETVVDNIDASTEDAVKGNEDAVTENESVLDDNSIDELFRSIEEEIKASETVITETVTEEVPTQDPFYSKDPNADTKQFEELQSQVDAYAKEKEELTNSVESLTNQVTEYQSKLKEMEGTVNDVNDLWKEAMEHPIIGGLLTKWINNEEINLASSVIDTLKNEASLMEDSSTTSSDPVPAKGGMSLQELMRQSKVKY